MMAFLASCDSGNDSVQIKSSLPVKTDKQNIKIPQAEPVQAAPVAPDSLAKPDTVESHEGIQRKPEYKIIRRVLNFHKKPLIT